MLVKKFNSVLVIAMVTVLLSLATAVWAESVNEPPVLTENSDVSEPDCDESRVFADVESRTFAA